MVDAAAGRREVGIIHYLVSYPDTDAGGIVNHGRYIDMAERARHHLLTSVGLSYAGLAKAHDTLLVVHKISATYVSSAVLEDSLRLDTMLSLCSAARTVWVTNIYRGNTRLVTVSAELAALAASTGAIRRHPDILLERLAPFLVTLGAAVAASREDAQILGSPSDLRRASDAAMRADG